MKKKKKGGAEERGKEEGSASFLFRINRLFSTPKRTRPREGKKKERKRKFEGGKKRGKEMCSARAPNTPVPPPLL